ncbi:MAG: hypothetical protein Q8M03_15150 [Legionella sp.]|nr:hypothetical protein [Legionella sp.]
MDKRYYTPVEMMKIATQHAYCADNLLRNHVPGRAEWDNRDSLLSIVSLMYIAFEITLRAYLLHDYRPVKQPKNLSELLELNRDLVFSSQDMQLLKSLSRQFAFRKGIDYNLWEHRQEFEVFCSEIVGLYERLQKMMPLELQEDYLQIG